MAGRRIIAIVAVLGSLGPGLAEAGHARDDKTAGGLSTAIDLRHQVVIPPILYFRLGSANFGAVEQVQFDVTPGAVGAGDDQSYSGSASVPVGDGTPISAANGTLTVEIMANVGALILNYDLSDPLGLGDGLGNYMPFDEIAVTSADPSAIPAPALSNAGAGGAISVPVTGNLYNGRVVQQSTTWTYTYLNQQVLAAGIYSGRVAYTVSAP